MSELGVSSDKKRETRLAGSSRIYNNYLQIKQKKEYNISKNIIVFFHLFAIERLEACI
jgi:hypothetical protein